MIQREREREREEAEKKGRAQQQMLISHHFDNKQNTWERQPFLPFIKNILKLSFQLNMQKESQWKDGWEEKEAKEEKKWKLIKIKRWKKKAKNNKREKKGRKKIMVNVDRIKSSILLMNKIVYIKCMKLASKC